MKVFLTIARLIVGSLFIVSGLIKCNDTIGFSYKLNDYFAADVLGLEFLIPYSLILAVVICVVEIVLGVAVIFGFKSKLTTTLILLMMLFFTWLTWYTSSCLEAQEIASKLGESFDKNCVTDCGCFGDALKLTPKESFYKDLFLLIFTIPLFVFAFKGMIPKNKPKQDVFYITASLLLILVFGVFVIGWWFTLIFSALLYGLVYLVKRQTDNEWFSLLVVYIISLGFTWYCLQNLPLKDFRAYKIDSNILENMSMPENAPKAIVDYHWKFNVNGSEQVLTTRGSYPEVEGGEFVSVETEEIEAGYEIPILDFSIEREGQDFTEAILNEDNVLMIVMYNLAKSEAEGLTTLKSITDDATKKGYKVVGITASNIESQQEIANAYNLNFDFYFCDEKALKTVIRSNPGVLKLKQGTIIQKLHWNDIDDLSFD